MGKDEKAESNGQEGNTLRERRFSARAEQMLRSAQAAALELGHGYVGCEHLLLAMLREEEDAPGRALRAEGGGGGENRPRQTPGGGGGGAGRGAPPGVAPPPRGFLRGGRLAGGVPWKRF